MNIESMPQPQNEDFEGEVKDIENPQKIKEVLSGVKSYDELIFTLSNLDDSLEIMQDVMYSKMEGDPNVVDFDVYGEEIGSLLKEKLIFCQKMEDLREFSESLKEQRMQERRNLVEESPLTEAIPYIDSLIDAVEKGMSLESVSIKEDLPLDVKEKLEDILN